MTGRRHGTVASLVAVVFFGAAAPVASASGFGPVRDLSPVNGIVDQVTAAVAPTGETAVMWRQGTATLGEYEFVATTGPDAENLGPVRIVEPARGAPSRIAGARLLARPGGGFVACFNGGGRRVALFGCSFTDASRTFGPLRIVERRSRRSDPSYRVEMRPDGKLAVLIRHNVGKHRARLLTTTFDGQGQRGPVRPLATVDRETYASLVTTADGGTAVAWRNRPRGRNGDASARSLYLTAPGSDVFGRTQVVLPRGARNDLGARGVSGDRELNVVVSDDVEYVDDGVVMYRRPDGSFSPPLRLPRPAPGFLRGTLLPLPDGPPLAISVATRESQTDCSNVSAGVVGAGPLVPASRTAATTTQRLSTPGQIATQLTAAALADGTVIAAWENGADDGGDTRLEVAIRPADSNRFQRSQVLPKLSTWGKELAAGGNQAILVWMAGDHVDGPSRVVASSLRAAPPYAAPTALPKRPRMPCQ